MAGLDYRPAWHYTPARHWINDPNGLIWLDGEYHLFYQHNPFGNDWGHMSWGHAVSTDLLHWQELPLAIPENERVSIYSGSVVLDAANTSGFGTATLAPLVAIYTGCRRVSEGGQAQELAWSLDQGRTWTQHAGNPVLDIGLRDFRDPKVFWHEPTGRWVMAVVRPDDHQVSFYGSPNLRDWTHLSDFGPAGEVGGIWECPDLIEFPGGRWLLKVDTFAGHPGGTGAQVFIGRFDGQRFVADQADSGQGLWVDHGSDFYAALSWANLPAERHDAPVWIAWMNNHAYAKRTPTAPWRGAMTLPRELFLFETSAGTRLGQRPWPGIESLRGALLPQQLVHLNDARQALELGEADGRSLDLLLRIDVLAADTAGLRVHCHGEDEGVVIGIDRRRGCVFIDRSRSGDVVDAKAWSGRREAPLPAAEVKELRVLLDHCSVEVFVDGGRACLTELVFPASAEAGAQLFAQGGLLAGTLSAWPLKAAMHAAR